MTMKRTAIFGAAGVVIAVLIIASVLTSGLLPWLQNKGTLVVKLTDAPVELTHLNITITGLAVQKADENAEDNGWIPLPFIDGKTSVSKILNGACKMRCWFIRIENSANSDKLYS